MKKYTLYRRPETYLAVSADTKPPQEEICERIKSFTVEPPYFLNAVAYAKIYDALIKLGYTDPLFTMKRISPRRYMVDITGFDVTGIYDTRRNTFVD